MSENKKPYECVRPFVLNKLIAAYIVAKACDETIGGTYSFTAEELEHKLELTEGYINQYAVTILEYINKYSQVAAIEWNKEEQEFEIDLFLWYCGVKECEE